MPSFRLSFISLPKRLQPFQALLQQCCIDGQIQSDKAGAAFSKGNAEIPDEVYERMYKLWREKIDG